MLVIGISLAQLPMTLTILSQTRWSAMRGQHLTSPRVTARLYSDLPDCAVLCNKSIAYQHQSAARVSKSKIKVHHYCCCRKCRRHVKRISSEASTAFSISAKSPVMRCGWLQLPVALTAVLHSSVADSRLGKAPFVSCTSYQSTLDPQFACPTGPYNQIN